MRITSCVIKCFGGRRHPKAVAPPASWIISSALRFVQRAVQRPGEFGLLAGVQEAPEFCLLIALSQRQPAHFTGFRFTGFELHPERVEAPFLNQAFGRNPPQKKLHMGDRDVFIFKGISVTGVESQPKQQNVDAEKSRDGPGADQKKRQADQQADERNQAKHDAAAPRSQRAVRGQPRREELSVKRGHRMIRAVWRQTTAYNELMATKSQNPKSRKQAAPKPVAAAAVAEIFRRFREIQPEPKGELEHVNAYTLLVAVVLSAQATDAGVNKATRALFAAADTPEKMLALGEDQVREQIRTIGLFRTKAKNVIALSALLLRDHGGVVPASRDDLVKLPGVGRKTANVVLNMAFGQPTIAVDTHLFRVSNRIPLAIGKTPDQVEAGLEKIIPDEYRLHAHHWLILHGRYICKARKPECGRCAISELCLSGEKSV